MANATTMTMRGWAVLLGMGLGVSLGCLSVRPNPDHCANLEGDRTCADRYPGERMFCTACGATPEDGCVAERPDDDNCYSPCGGRSAFDEDATCLAESSSSSGEESTSTGMETGTETGSSESSTTGPMPCVGNEDCPDAAAPFCEPVSGECVACDGTEDPDAACAGLDPELPLCVDGACVACTPENPAACTGTAPICDGATNTCVPCVAHDQCGGPACNLYTGACLPADRVFEVGGPAADYPNLTMALADQAPDTETTFIVHPGMPSYDEAVVVGEGRTVAFLAAEIGPGIEPPRWVQTSGTPPQLTVTTAATVLMDGLQLSDGELGLLVDSGRVWVDRSRIVQNSGGGVLAQNGAELTLRNCFVGRNGDDFADTRGITATASVVDVVYTTIVANDGTAASGPISMSCDAATTGEVRNSIVAAGDDTIACANVSFSFSVVDTAGLTGSDNAVLSFDPAWFPNIAMSDFHIAAGMPFADIAQWSTSDPPTDIDGEPRPNVDGDPDYAGADLPQ